LREERKKERNEGSEEECGMGGREEEEGEIGGEI